MNWRLALVAFVVLPFIVLTARWFRSNVRSRTGPCVASWRGSTHSSRNI